MPPSPSHAEPARDAYLGAVLTLLAVALAGAVAAWKAGGTFANPALAEAALTLVVGSGVLAGVAMAQRLRLRPPPAENKVETPGEAADPAPVAPEFPAGPDAAAAGSPAAGNPVSEPEEERE